MFFFFFVSDMEKGWDFWELYRFFYVKWIIVLWDRGFRKLIVIKVILFCGCFDIFFCWGGLG